MPNEDGKKQHATRQDTEKRQYDRLREAGIPHDGAKSRSEKGSELVHRGQDRLNSDGNPRRKDR